MGNRKADRSLADRASELLRAKSFAAAAATAREAVAADPADAEAHNTLGTALAQLGDPDGAERAYWEAARAAPSLYKPHANLATVYAKRGQLDRAAARLLEATRLAPDIARLWTRLGQALLQVGSAGEATSAFERALQLEESVMNRAALATAHLRAGEPKRALVLLEARELGSEALARVAYAEACHRCRDPRAPEAIDAAAKTSVDPESARLLAGLALEHGRFESAARLARAARSGAADPDADDVVLLESASLEASGDPDAALTVVEAAFNAKPSVKKVVTLSELAQRARQHDRAVAPLQAARVLFPDSADVLVAWGRLCRAQRDYDGAHRSFEAALALDPVHAGALFNLGVAEATFYPGARALDLLERACQVAPSDPSPYAALLFAELHAGMWSPAERLARHAGFCRRFGMVAETAGVSPVQRREGRLRVGYLSADFRDHALMRFLEGQLLAHDRARFEVFVYASVSSPDVVTQRVREMDLVFRDVYSLSDAAAAGVIAADELDVLVALDGHTAGGRLRILTHEPVPVIVSYLGYPASFGMGAVGFRITDDVADPPGNEAHYTESLLRLPHAAWCFGSAPELSTEREGDATLRFASFNRSAKLSAQTLACFREILERLPTARLLLKAPTSESARLRDRVEEALGAASTRVDFEPWTATNDEHLAVYRKVDVALDTFPYAGTTTTAEALWMGVPVVTLAGSTHAERVGASLLTAVGLESLVATTTEEYVERAIGIANDVARRDRLRRELRRTMQARPIADPVAFTRSFEACIGELAARPRPPSRPRGTRVVRTDVGAQIVVPDTLGVATTFVIQEQERWFEEEVPFVRAVVGPDDVFVDIGANLGVYTVEAARAASRVVAFEPSSSTAAMLRASIALNELENVRVHQAAVGGSDGTAHLVLGSGPELSHLGSGPGPSEEVPVRTLNAWADDVRGMTFLKLDAEGSEIAIVNAAGALIAREAPTVMFELRHVNQLNTGLIEAFVELGFGIYRLCPGLRALVPFDTRAPIDPFQLNLFAVRPERARVLEARGFLADAPATEAPGASDAQVAAWLKARPLLAALDQARALEITRPLRHLVRAEDPSLGAAERFAELLAADREAEAWLRAEPSPEARLTAARAALAAGRRARARDVMASAAWRETSAPVRLFACPLPEYELHDSFDPTQLYRAQHLEASVVLSAFSSVYQNPQVLGTVAEFFRVGGRSARMERRLGLLVAKLRAGV